MVHGKEVQVGKSGCRLATEMVVEPLAKVSISLLVNSLPPSFSHSFSPLCFVNGLFSIHTLFTCVYIPLIVLMLLCIVYSLHHSKAAQLLILLWISHIIHSLIYLFIIILTCTGLLTFSFVHLSGHKLIHSLSMFIHS